MSESLTLTLTQRDAQWVAAALSVCATLLEASDEAAAHNLLALCQLLAKEYSATEANTLVQRVRALLPPSATVCFQDGPLMDSTTTLVS